MSMLQTAPLSAELAAIVEALRYREDDGWQVWLTDDEYDRGQGCTGTTLIVQTCGRDAYHPERTSYRVRHLFPVPPAAYNRQSWQRWVLDRLIDVETHEACEHFIVDGTRPFAPNHGPGYDPYRIVEYETDLARRTRFTGEVAPE